MRSIILGFSFVIMVTATATSSAALLYGTSNAGGPASDLYAVDPTTGTTSLIGNVGYAVNGLESFDGRLWGTTSVNDPNFHGLIEIDPTTGAGTPIGGGWSGDLIVELAFDSSGNAYAWTEDSDGLVTIDLLSGTHSAALGDSGIGSYEHGIAFDLNDMLYMVNSDEDIFTVDTITGAGTLSTGNHGFYAHHGDIDPASGIYYGLDFFESPHQLRLVDLASGSLQSSVDLDRQLHTLAWASVPEPATAVLAVSGLAGLGFARRRR